MKFVRVISWVLIAAYLCMPVFEISSAQAASISVHWFNGTYQNGEVWDYTTDLNHANYGTHDWIADHAMNMLPAYERVWITNNLNTFLLGTEAPDNASLDYLGTNTGYGDFSNHVVAYNAGGTVTNDAAARRAQEEYNKAASALPWDEAEAAYYAGAMTHYIADQAVFSHVVGGTSFLPSASHHSDYERGVESATLSYNAGKFEKYLVTPGTLAEASAYETALQVAKVTTFGYGKTKPALWMDQNFPTQGDSWNISANASFTDSVGDSLYRAVVACAKVLHELATSKGYTLERIPQNGTTRYDTAIGISKKVFPTSKTASTVVLVSGNNPIDAIAAGPFAKQKNGVVLFTDAGSIPISTLNEMQRLLPNSNSSRVYVIGGTAVIDASVDTYLQTHFAYTVTRLGTVNRYDTSVQIAQNMNAVSSAFVTQTNAIDGIAAGSVGAKNGYPILLTEASTLSSVVSDFLANDTKGQAIHTVYVLGGTGAVSEDVVSALTLLGKTVVRLAGASNRFDTARVIAETFYSEPTKTILANGYSLADAVVGSVLAGKYALPILLTSQGALSATTQTYIDNNQDSLAGGYVLGGTGAVSYNAERVAGIHME